jgi:hypothetical protein
MDMYMEMKGERGKQRDRDMEMYMEMEGERGKQRYIWIWIWIWIWREKKGGRGSRRGKRHMQYS